VQYEKKIVTQCLPCMGYPRSLNCTSAGDGLTGKESSIPNYAKGTKVLPGLGIEGKRAQENPDSVRPQVQQWLARLGFAK